MYYSTYHQMDHKTLWTHLYLVLTTSAVNLRQMLKPDVLYVGPLFLLLLNLILLYADTSEQERQRHNVFKRFSEKGNTERGDDREERSQHLIWNVCQCLTCSIIYLPCRIKISAIQHIAAPIPKARMDNPKSLLGPVRPVLEQKRQASCRCLWVLQRSTHGNNLT